MRIIWTIIKINLLLGLITIGLFLCYVPRANAFDCNTEKQYSMLWYYNECGGDKEEPKVKTIDDRNTPTKGYPYNSGEIPQDATPDNKILKHYLKKYISYGNPNEMNRVFFKIKKKKNKIKEFKFNLKTDDFVIEQLNETALLSYLMYVNGAVVIDEITPKDRFGKIFKNKTRYVSNSVGKSIFSYITGHAVCRGYVDGIHQPLNWDILENTLYEGQPLINLLNMAAGDQKYFDNTSFRNSKRWVNGHSVQSLLSKELKNSTASENKKYWYSNMNTNIIASYVLYKMGDKEFRKMLNEIFVDKVGIEYDMVFYKQRGAKRKQPTVTYGMHITRYDYLRIAVAMLNDWNNNTCEGQYLKSLYENKIDKGFRVNDTTKGMSNSNSYAGQFYVGMSGKRNKPILIMDGFGGQNIVIDFENNKITSVLAIHRNYNWMKLVHNKF